MIKKIILACFALCALASATVRYAANSAGTFSGGASVITGSVSSGTFSAAETVTQATSGATATFSSITVKGSVPGSMIVTGVTGSPDASHTWTGNSSGATFAPTATPLSHCNGQTAITVATLNSVTFSAGDTTYLCGAISAPANASGFISVGQSGTSGSLISFVFDAGAVLTATYWGPSGPITSSGTSYLLIDGGPNGTIQATANGTGLANSVYATEGITFTNVSNSTVKNVTEKNLYVHLCTPPVSSCTDDNDSTVSPAGILWEGGSGVTVSNNTFSNMYAGLRYVAPGAGTFTNIDFDHNDVGFANWDVTLGISTSNTNINGFTIHDNIIHDWTNWGTDNNSNHHDGVFIFTVSSSCGITGSGMSGGQIYNNQGYNGGQDGMTGFVFIEDDNCAGQLITGTGVYNNVWYEPSYDIPGDGFIVDWAQSSVVVNNTIQGHSTSSSGLWGIVVYGQGSTLKNNIVDTAFVNLGYASGSSLTASDYNDGYTVAYWGDNGGTTQTTLANWQSTTSFDAHSISTNPNLNASSSPPYQLTNTSSPAYRTGTNLTSLCSTYAALCTDANGVARPSSGAWDMGAYEDSSLGPTSSGSTRIGGTNTGSTVQ